MYLWVFALSCLEILRRSVRNTGSVKLAGVKNWYKYIFAPFIIIIIIIIIIITITWAIFTIIYMKQTMNEWTVFGFEPFRARCT